MATEVHLSDQRGRVLAALEDANEGLAVAEIVLAAQLRSPNAADVLLFKMTKSGDIERVKRGVYGIPGTVAKLAAKNPGKIGKKERSGGQTTEPVG
jgi:predicted transcriptional regulator of viral defense system